MDWILFSKVCSFFSMSLGLFASRNMIRCMGPRVTNGMGISLKISSGIFNMMGTSKMSLGMNRNQMSTTANSTNTKSNFPDLVNNSNLQFLQKKQKTIIHIKTSKNNTIVTLTLNGNVINSQSCGTVGLKKSHRKTSDAGFQAMMKLLQNNQEFLKTKRVECWFNGFGRSRDMCFRACKTFGLNISKVVDVTPIRHGGCRPRKKRRL